MIHFDAYCTSVGVKQPRIHEQLNAAREKRGVSYRELAIMLWKMKGIRRNWTVLRKALIAESTLSTTITEALVDVLEHPVAYYPTAKHRAA